LCDDLAMQLMGRDEAPEHEGAEVAQCRRPRRGCVLIQPKQQCFTAWAPRAYRFEGLLRR
jgi:hypothetical protein